VLLPLAEVLAGIDLLAVLNEALAVAVADWVGKTIFQLRQGKVIQ
jgi:hypothetical protein